MVDGATNTMLDPITGTHFSIGVGVDPTRNRVYVVDEMDHLFVIDSQTNVVTQTVNGMGSGFRIAVNPVTNKIWVACQGDGLKVVDGATFAVTSIPVAGILGAAGVAVNTVTNTVYVSGNHQVTVINGATNTIIANVAAAPGGSNAHDVAVNETTGRFYVTNHGGGSVGVYDGTTNTQITTLTLPGALNVFGIAVDKYTNKIWVANSSAANTAYVINGADDTVTTIPIGSWTVGVAVNTTTHHVYFSGGTIYVVDGS